MILPGMGVVSEIISTFSRKRIFGYSFVAVSSLAIAVIGFLVWGHHMFVAGDLRLRGDGLLGAELSAWPSRPPSRSSTGRATLYKGSISCDTPMLYALRLHRAVHDRRPDRPVPGDPGGRRARARHLLRDRPLPLHHGRRHGDGLPGRPPLLVAEDVPGACTRRSGASSPRSLIFVGFNLTFFPQFILGYLGMPRRYHVYPPEFQVLNVLSTAGGDDPRRRLPVPDLLPHLLALQGRARGRRTPGARPASSGRPARRRPPTTSTCRRS